MAVSRALAGLLVSVVSAVAAADATVASQVKMDMEQCRSLYDSLGGPADQVSQVLNSPIVKFLLRRGGLGCDVNWPREASDCSGSWSLPASSKKPAVTVQCTYKEVKHVCSCDAVGPVAEAFANIEVPTKLIVAEEKPSEEVGVVVPELEEAPSQPSAFIRAEPRAPVVSSDSGSSGEKQVIL